MRVVGFDPARGDDKGCIVIGRIDKGGILTIEKIEEMMSNYTKKKVKNKKLTKDQKKIAELEAQVGQLRNEKNTLDYHKRDAEKQRDGQIKEKDRAYEELHSVRRNFDQLSAEVLKAADLLESITHASSEPMRICLTGQALGVLDAASRIVGIGDRKAMQKDLDAANKHSFFVKEFR